MLLRTRQAVRNFNGFSTAGAGTGHFAPSVQDF